MRRRLLLSMAALVLLVQVGTMAQTRGAGPEQALLEIEHAWAAAGLKGDVAALDAILATSFVGVSAEGKVVTRAQWLADTKVAKLTRSASSDMKVTILSPTIGLVTGIWTGAGTDAKGRKFDTSERWTDVFVNEGGKWKCVSSQSTTITK